MAELEELMSHCKAVDQNTIPIYKHLIDKRHALDCNLLYYRDTQLIAYLRTFFFYAEACEVALMVHPEFRHQGIARQMLLEILPLVKQENMQQLIFSTPKDCNQSWLADLGLSYRSSEFQMQWDPQKKNAVSFKPHAIRLATIQDLDAIVQLDEVCFPKKNPNASDLFRHLLFTNNCGIFVVTHDGRVVGKAHIFKESDRARITDIGVFPDYRGQGIARALIKYCINHGLINNKPKITLDVEATNTSALKLYESLGFYITSAHDYWQTAQGAPEFGLSNLLHLSKTPPSQSPSSQKDTL